MPVSSNNFFLQAGKLRPGEVLDARVSSRFEATFCGLHLLTSRNAQAGVVDIVCTAVRNFILKLFSRY